MPVWVEQLEAGTLPRDYALTEDLLKKIGVHHTRSTEVLDALQAQEVLTWAGLLYIDTKAKLLGKVKNESACDIIWGFLEDYRRLGKPVPSELYTNRLQRVSEEREGLSHQLYRMIHYSQRGMPKPGEFMDFAESLFVNEETKARSLYVRECYTSLFDEISIFAQPGYTRRGFGGVAVIGTPGIGESGFGLYSVARFAQSRAVYYKYKSKPGYLILATQEIVNSISNTFPYIDRPGVYKVPSKLEEVIREELRQAIAVLDPPTDTTVLKANMFELIVSSPDIVKLKDFLDKGNHDHTVSCYAPVG